jgi:glutaminase
MSDAHSSSFPNMHSQPYALDKALLDEIIRSKMSPVGKDSPVEGIPHTVPDPEKRSITVMDAKTGQVVSTGDMEHRFSQQSMSKPTAMALAIDLMGGEKAYRQYVGVEASGRPYNDPTLLPDGRAFNSSVNTGALATWVLIMAHTPEGKEPIELYMDKMKALTGNSDLQINEAMATGEHQHRPPDGGKSGNQKLLDVLDNAGLTQVLEKRFGELTSEKGQQLKQELMDKAFLNYCKACAVMVNTRDMANVAAVYRNGGVRMNSASGEKISALPKETADFVQRSNEVSGSYNESGTQFVKSGFSGKTGVDGGIFGSLLGHDSLVVATHHSDLNAAGNSGEGQKWINELDKLNVAFPKKASFMARFKSGAGTNDLRVMSKGELGPSPRERDKQLRGETPSDVLDTIKNKLGSGEHENGFYLKQPDFSNGKDPLRGGTPLITAEDANGDLKKYTLAKGDHDLSKVVVTHAPPADRQLPAIERGDPNYWGDLAGKVETPQEGAPSQEHSPLNRRQSRGPVQ